MKTKFNIFSQQTKAALMLGILGTTAAIGLTQTAEAAPRVIRRDRDRDRGRDNRRPREITRVYVGKVTKERGRNLFDFKADGKTYNVYTINTLPRRLDKNDTVRVSGTRYGENDIRNARISIVRNR